ncbi:MAG: hypothetical protein KDA93_19630 [Planctomycetaceae bacterium]|nr:hypothetical protein [Planctomycetaceae bacterium]
MSSLNAPELIEVDPAELHLPPSRLEGADPAKLQRQIASYGLSIVGMLPIWVSRGTDGRYMINNGVTRATRVAKLLPGTNVMVEVIDLLTIPASRFPTVKDKLP